MKLFHPDDELRAPPRPPQKQLPVPERRVQPPGPPKPNSPTLKTRPVPKVQSNVPIFIKIDKYNEIVRNLQQLRSYTIDMRDVLNVMVEVQKEVDKGLAVAERTIDKLNSVISLMDSKLLKSQIGEARLEAMKSSVKPSEEIEDYMKEIGTEMRRLKNDLNNVR